MCILYNVFVVVVVGYIILDSLLGRWEGGHWPDAQVIFFTVQFFFAFLHFSYLYWFQSFKLSLLRIPFQCAMISHLLHFELYNFIEDSRLLAGIIKSLVVCSHLHNTLSSVYNICLVDSDDVHCQLPNTWICYFTFHTLYFALFVPPIFYALSSKKYFVCTLWNCNPDLST